MDRMVDFEGEYMKEVTKDRRVAGEEGITRKAFEAEKQKLLDILTTIHRLVGNNSPEQIPDLKNISKFMISLLNEVREIILLEKKDLKQLQESTRERKDKSYQEHWLLLITNLEYMKQEVENYLKYWLGIEKKIGTKSSLPRFSGFNGRPIVKELNRIIRKEDETAKSFWEFLLTIRAIHKMRTPKFM